MSIQSLCNWQWNSCPVLGVSSEVVKMIVHPEVVGKRPFINIRVEINYGEK